jgi:hypothetical protein
MGALHARRVRATRCATYPRRSAMPDATSQTVRSQRWRAGIATRLDEIKAELEQLSSEITVQLATLTDRLAEQERQVGLEQ